MFQNSELISHASHRKPTQRRSLLRKPLGDRDRRPPFWRLVLTAYAVAVVLYMLWVLLNVITGTMPEGTSLRTLLMNLWPIALFVLPITIIGHFSSKLVDRHGRRLPLRGTRMLYMAIWLGSGITGSLIGYEVTNLLVHGVFSFNPSVIAITFTANILIVLFVSITGAIIGARRRGRLMYRQERLLTDEFEAAHRMQQSLLPERDAHIYGFDISSGMYPAVEIGGDYYDYLSFADGSKGILVADAAGKGIPAALIMAKFQGMAQALSIHVSNPEEFFTGLNDTLRVRLDRHSFITVGMVTIDFDNHCAFWRAGHNPLFHYRHSTGEVIERKPSGIALGLTHGGTLGNSLQSDRFAMEQEDVLLLYSDGLTEATNPEGEEFGEQRLQEALKKMATPENDASGIRSALLDELEKFVGDAEVQHDDVTIVVIKRV